MLALKLALVAIMFAGVIVFIMVLLRAYRRYVLGKIADPDQLAQTLQSEDLQRFERHAPNYGDAGPMRDAFRRGRER